MADLYRIKTVFTGVAGSPYYNTLYFLASAGTASQAAVDVAGFWGAVDGFIKNTLTWDLDTDVEVIDSTSGNIVNVQSVSPASGTGGDAGDMLPPATQALIRWRTGMFVGGREIRGKTFVPAITETQSTAGQPSSALITALENSAAGLVGSPNAQLVVYSRKNSTYAPVTSGSAWGQFAVLRSRRD